MRNTRQNGVKTPPGRCRTGASVKSRAKLKRIFDEIEQIRRQIEKPQSSNVKTLIPEEGRY